MKIISVSGLDGSGKSTQIKLLKNYLELQGKKVFYFHAIQFGIAQKISDFFNNRCIIAKICRKSAVLRSEPGSATGVTKANFLQIGLRRIFLMLDLLRFKSLISKLQKDGFDYMLSDRYFYDTLINIYFLRGSDKKIKCEDKIVRADVAIYLQANPEIIMSRERKPDQGIEYLQKKKELYDRRFAVWNMKLIDGNKNQESIFEEIKENV